MLKYEIQLCEKHLSINEIIETPEDKLSENFYLMHFFGGKGKPV